VRNAARLEYETPGRSLELHVDHPDTQAALQHVERLVLPLVDVQERPRVGGEQDEGASPSVTEVAAAAGVSRATAYLYFPTQGSLIAEAIVPDSEAALAAEALPEDLEGSFAAAFATMWSSFAANEATYRTVPRSGASA
jgi:hypothetical protein